MRTLIALIVAAAVSFCIGCGSSNNNGSTTSSNLTGTWSATIPAATPASTSTSSSSTSSTSTSTPTGPQLQFAFTLGPVTPGNNNAGGSAAPTQNIPNSTPMVASAFTPTATGGCFDNAAQVSASQVTQSGGAIQSMVVSISENGNTMGIDAVLSPDGQTASGQYNLTGTGACASSTGTISLTRGPASSTTNPPTSPTPAPGTQGH